MERLLEMDPQITIVIPVYKTELWLRPCVDSILEQTFADFELILVDDGSPDGCPAICDEYAKKDSRVRVLHKENGGVVSALLAGINAATAPYIGFVDSDDWIDPAYYGHLLDAMERTGADVAVAPYVMVRPEDGAEDAPARSVPDGPVSGRDLLYTYYSNAVSVPPVDVVKKCTKLYRRALVADSLRYLSADVWHGEDSLMNAAILADSAAVTFLPDGTRYYYRLRDDSACHRDDFESMTDALAKNELVFLRTFLRIVRDKGLDEGVFHAFLGRVAYAAVLHYCARRDVSYGEKRRYVRQILSAVPPESPAAYARQRGSLAVQAYCLLLRARILTPCILSAALLRQPTSGGRP